MGQRLRVLVACERSGKVREAFRKLGHYAVSCDIEPADDNSKHHFQCDVLDLLKPVQKSRWLQWDLMIGHPPCTYLCNSGVSWLYNTKLSSITSINTERWAKMKQAVDFFRALWLAPIPFIALENPIPHKHGIPMKYDQIIQPWMFGHPERKATCLWLRNLPPLVPTRNVKAQMLARPKAKAQRLHWLGPSADRSRIRSETYQGIATAMAEQWSKYICKILNRK